MFFSSLNWVENIDITYWDLASVLKFVTYLYNMSYGTLDVVEAVIGIGRVGCGIAIIGKF
jgi:hypothetical protein